MTFSRRFSALLLLAAVLGSVGLLPQPANALSALSIGRAKHAIRATLAIQAHPSSVSVQHCLRRSPWAIRCVAIEEQVTMPTTDTGLGVIEILRGHLTVRLQHHRHPDYNYLRVSTS